MRKKAITCLRETREWKTCVCVLELGIQKLSTKILGCLPYPHSTRQKLIDMIIGQKFLELRKKSVNRKNNGYLFALLP